MTATLKLGQIINIETKRNLFGSYKGRAKVTNHTIDDIWKYNGYIVEVELLDVHGLDNDIIPIEIDDIE